MASQPATVVNPVGQMVRAESIRRSFGPREVLRGIELDLADGEFVALLGRSGSGKSTLLRILAGLDPEAEGSAVVPDQRAVVFQDARLLPWLHLLENVTLGLRDKEAAARGFQALAEVGLEDRAGDWPKNLSGGEAQRVALARALVRHPGLLLLDEPFGALDALTRIKMHELLARLCAKYHPSVLLVTHDVDEALLLAHRILVLTDGRISLDLAVEIDGPRRRDNPGMIALRSRLLVELGVVEVPEDIPAQLVVPVTPA
jgi:sulfonate transport system ATP-binding protein